ncbi:MAG: ABC transporter ATP-binding protein [Solirubrobacteraceae bacterium]
MTTPVDAIAGAPAVAARGTVDVRLENVVKRFGDTVAVDDVVLDIARGEFFSLLGPSGCGKTTTLSMIGGFELPTSGRIYLGGNDVSRVPPYKRDVNTVFQSYALFPHLNVFDNVAFGLRRRRLAKADIERRVAEALRLVDLPTLEKRTPAQLSGGQQQRVALARALVNEPRVLLLDEPLGALDLKLRKQMQLELKRIQQDVGITFLYVTHDQEEAMVMSDRLAVMNGGKIEQLGSPEDVYEYPSTEFVASFLGVSNLIPATVAERGDSSRHALVMLADGTQARVPSGRLTTDSRQVKIGVRPEKLHLLDVGATPEPGSNVVTGRVVLATYVGVSHQYTVQSPEGASLTVYVQNLGVTRPPALGDTVQLAWQPEHTFVV